MKSRAIIFFIIALSVFLRVYNLAHVPPAPSLDEVSIGWNAYSLLLTGKDEFQIAFPTVLRAYDDYRPAAYVYLVMPFVSMLGLSALAVRLPSVLLSVVSVMLVYAIARRAGNMYRQFPYAGEVAAFLMAISPWHIYLSRLGHEVNLGMTLFLLGVCTLFEFIHTNKGKWLLFAAASFGASLWGYQSEKLITPLFVAVFAVLYASLLKKHARFVLISIFLGAIFVINPLTTTLSDEGLSRYRGTTAFSPYSDTMIAYTQRYVDAVERNDLVGRLQNSRVVAYVSIFSQNYLSHFAPGWVFFGAEREAHKVPGVGLLYWWEAVFLAIGVWIFLNKDRSLLWWLIISGVLLSPLPAAITTQSPHAMRSFTALPFFILIETAGFVYIATKRFSYKRVGTAVLVVFVMASLYSFWKGYFTRFPQEQSDAFQYALRDAMSYAMSHESDFEKISVSHQRSLYQSYMFYLFYSSYNPASYALSGGTVSGGYEASHVIGNYSFGFLPQRVSELEHGVLYLYDLRDVPAGAHIIERFADKNGSISIAAVVTQETLENTYDNQ